MRMRKKRKKTKTGARLALTFLLALPVWLAGALSVPLLSAFPASASDAKRTAVVAGTVFRDPGFAFPRVEITLTPVTLPAGVKKLKPLRLFSDARGEFAFYPPAGQARYRVSATAPGFSPEEKTVEIQADERVDVYLTLKPNAR